MIRVAQKLATGAYDESTELEEITTQAMGELANCGTDFGRHGVIAASEYAAAVLEDYEAEQDGGLTLGFPMLDSVLTFKPGDLFIVASRPGMGKTGLVNRISLNQLKVGVRVLQFTIEMTGKQLVSRMANDLSSTSISATRHKSLTPADQQRFYSAVGQIATWPLTVTYGPLSPALVRRDLTRHISRYGKPGLVIVDHLHLMTPDNPRGMSREQQIGQISNQLKGIALAFDVPMLVAAQMNRANEVRVGREPELSDLRDSGSLEQDSDLVVFIHRDGYYDELADPGQAAVLIRKNRWGAAPHTVPLFWLAESGTFRNLDNRQVPQASHLEKSSQKYNGDAAKAKPLHF
jgi:replicative DNA helicase